MLNEDLLYCITMAVISVHGNEMSTLNTEQNLITASEMQILILVAGYML
jgi:hypothetical protein